MISPDLSPWVHILFTPPHILRSSFYLIFKMSTPENNQEGGPPAPHVSLSVNTSPQARAKRRIAALMEEVEILKQDKATKQRCARC